MKPRMGPPPGGKYWKFWCRGPKQDGRYAYGFGHTMEQAYQGWLDYIETDIPF